MTSPATRIYVTNAITTKTKQALLNTHYSKDTLTCTAKHYLCACSKYLQTLHEKKKNQKQCFNSLSVFIARFCSPPLPTVYYRPSLNLPNTSCHAEWVPFTFPYFFMLLLFLFNKKCEIDWNYNDTIPGMYRSGALISYLGATGSDLLY